jgi:acyl-CoA dehydrogenase
LTQNIASPWPTSFDTAGDASSPAIAKLVEFFCGKGLAALKQEDRDEACYDDWLAYQARHQLYAAAFSPARYSSLGNRFDLLELARFLEAFAYFSPAHGYSMQCTFLGLFPILMSANEPLKREAIALLEKGGLFALGVSERSHGSDFLGNEFTVHKNGSDARVASGSKYYIGNANVAAMITILAKRSNGRAGGGNGRGTHGSRRVPMILFALRNQNGALAQVRKIPTFGIRSAFVGEFDVRDYPVPPSDVFAEHRSAWEDVFGTIALGKFFLGFGAIGIAEHAFAEAWAHISSRELYGKPVTHMPHIRVLIARAYARLAAMKLFAYRAVGYFECASEHDRRYLLFSAVQKAKVSTDGVRVIDTLLECIGARGFESATYFEMALRDSRLLPVLEGSSHINFALAGQFGHAYCNGSDAHAQAPASKPRPFENEYLFAATSVPPRSVRFGDPRRAYEQIAHVESVRAFVGQFDAFRSFVRSFDSIADSRLDDTELAIAIGKCVSTVAFAQLVAEHVHLLRAPSPIVSLIFSQLVEDLGMHSLGLAAAGTFSEQQREHLNQMMVQRPIDRSDVDFVIDWIEQESGK